MGLVAKIHGYIVMCQGMAEDVYGTLEGMSGDCGENELWTW